MSEVNTKPTGPDFRRIVRAARLASEGKCPHCGRNMPKIKKEEANNGR